MGKTSHVVNKSQLMMKLADADTLSMMLNFSDC